MTAKSTGTVGLVLRQSGILIDPDLQTLALTTLAGALTGEWK